MVGVLFIRSWATLEESFSEEMYIKAFTDGGIQYAIGKRMKFLDMTRLPLRFPP